MKKLLLLSFLLLLVCMGAHATHLKGGYLRYVHLEGRTYSIVLTIYSDSDSPVLVGSSGTLDFGDGTVLDLSSPEYSERITKTPINDQIDKNELILEHTYPGNGSYLITYSELYRDEGIQNIENSSRVPFYLESFLLIDDLIRNTSSAPGVYPAFRANQGQTYHYGPKAYDPDGDSLSFHLTTAKQSINTPAPGYTFPHLTFEGTNGSETGEASYSSMNLKTGDIIWDSPLMMGTYVLAFEIREWRKIEDTPVLVGSVLHDILVNVEEPTDELQLFFPIQTQEVYLEQETPWETTIRAVASNPEDTVVLILSGSFLEQTPETTPADSVGGKGEVSITIQYTPTDGGRAKHQLIATAYIYSTTAEPSSERNRAAYLLEPGYVQGISEQAVKRLKLYPNPSFDNRIFVDHPILNGKGIELSFLAPDGRLAYHTVLSSFSSRGPVQLPQFLKGYYLVLIRQGQLVYTSRIIFAQK